MNKAWKFVKGVSIGTVIGAATAAVAIITLNLFAGGNR